MIASSSGSSAGFTGRIIRSLLGGQFAIAANLWNVSAHDRWPDPEPWHARVTLRRTRRWVHATRAAARHNAALPATAPILHFYPMRPQPNAPITTILRRLSVRIGFAPRSGEPTIAWDGDTWFSHAPRGVFQPARSTAPALISRRRLWSRRGVR